MDIRNLHRTDLCNPEFRTQFFQLLQAPVLDEELALFCFEKRKGSVMTFVGIGDVGTEDQDMPIATVSVVLERKFLRGGMAYGHIEDVNVSPNHRHEGLGTEIMTYAMQFTKRYCGRVVLECKPHLESFYQTHGFITHSIAMRQQNEKPNKPNFSREIKDSSTDDKETDPSTDNPSTVDASTERELALNRLALKAKTVMPTLIQQYCLEKTEAEKELTRREFLTRRRQ